MVSNKHTKTYRPVHGQSQESKLVPTTRKNRKAISRVVAESTFFGLGHRYKYAQMGGIKPTKHIEVPDNKPSMEKIERLLEAKEASLEELKKLQKELSSADKTRLEPIYELEDKYSEDDMYVALMKVLFDNLPEDYDPDDIDEGVVMEAFADFWKLRAGTI